jgi:hypothetical protein
MQEEYMKSIWEKFDGSVRALVPLFDQEVRGCAMLREAAQKLMTRFRHGLKPAAV